MSKNHQQCGWLEQVIESTRESRECSWRPFCLAFADLVLAAEEAEIQLSNFESMCRRTDRTEHADELAETLRALRSALLKAKGEGK